MRGNFFLGFIIFAVLVFVVSNFIILPIRRYESLQHENRNKIPIILFEESNSSIVPSCSTIYSFSEYIKTAEDRLLDYTMHVDRIGIEPMKSYRSMNRLIKSNRLVPVPFDSYGFGLKLKDTNMRYLVPKARQLLYDLALIFKNRICNSELWHARLKVTSILRTKDNNPNNSSENSPHKRGCAFDISYVSFLDLNGLELVLSECQQHYLENELSASVEDLKANGRLFKTREIGPTSKCFHIVVR